MIDTSISHVCTLFEGNYHLGVAGLVNSLYKTGYRGIIWAGYRGPLPLWATAVRQTPDFIEYHVAEGCYIRFVALETDVHFANYKPLFMTSLLNSYLGPQDNIFYIDPDITVKARWRLFEDWVSSGIALVEDCTYPFMPGDHPLRRRWLDAVSPSGFSRQRILSRYYNSGFVGVRNKDRDALRVWDEILRASKESGYLLNGFKSTSRTDLWHAADQDHLNVMLMTTNFPLSTVGREGMDFGHDGGIMSHAVDAPKPWAKSYFTSSLRGVPPSLADKSYWTNVSGPISLFPPAVIRRQNLAVLIGSAIGRFYKRG